MVEVRRWERSLCRRGKKTGCRDVMNCWFLWSGAGPGGYCLYEIQWLGT